MIHEASKSPNSPIGSVSEKYFELLLITIVLAGTLLVHHLIQAEYLMLHFYYLPVVLAAHYFGRKLAGTTALLSFLTVTGFVLVDPVRYMDAVHSPLFLATMLCTWGAFLGLCAILVGTLCDQRAAYIKELRNAHMGIIEILSKYLQAADQYTKSHSMRVADLAEAIAEELGVKPEEVENIKVGALLHDIGKVEVSTHLIQTAADLTDGERSEMATHTFHGAELVRSLGSILQGAIPVILHHHDHYSPDSKSEGEHGKEIPLGARIVAVGDAYDAIVTDRPYRRGRTPKEAIGVIRECAGKQFDPEVVRAFERVMVNLTNEDDVDHAERGVGTAASSKSSVRPEYNVDIPVPDAGAPERLDAEQPT